MTPPDRARARDSLSAASFYAAALSAADRAALDHVRGVDGLADEIALLRLRDRLALAVLAHHTGRPALAAPCAPTSPGAPSSAATPAGSSPASSCAPPSRAGALH